MDGPHQAHMKSHFCLVKYVIETKKIGLVMMLEESKIKNTWELTVTMQEINMGAKAFQNL
jgi:hypothetical protein